MAENIATVVNWYGPYSLEEAARSAQTWGTRGLYAAVGHKLLGTRGPRRLLYVGISEDIGARLGPTHHKLPELEAAKIWIGEIAVAGIPGRRSARTDPHLNSAEWALVRFLAPSSNEKKTLGLPSKSCLLLNRWWEYDATADEYSAQQRPSAGWADIIEYDDYRGTANLIWLGKKARVKAIAL